MRKTWLKTASVDELIRTYSAAAAAAGRATEAGDYKTNNRNVDIIAKIYDELRVRGREALLSLLPLLHHEDPGVRCSAAADTLEISPEQAERVLEDLAPTPNSLVAFNARMALKHWRKGAARFP